MLPGALATLPDVPAAPLFAAIWMVCLIAIGFTIWRYRMQRVAVSTAMIAALSMSYLNLVAMPLAETYRGHREFAERVRQSIGGDEAQLALYRTREIVYYLHPPRDIREFTDEVTMADAVRRGSVRFAIVHERDVGKLSLPCEMIAREPSHAWDTDAAGVRTVLVAFRGLGQD